MKFKTAYFILALFLMIITCFNCSTPCARAWMSFGLISFTDEEADTILMYNYLKESNFLNPKDSFQVIRWYKRNNDTLNWTSQLGSDNLYPDYDYKIYFPDGAYQYLITDIFEDKSKMKNSLFNCAKVLCVNSITSLKINGKTILPDRADHFYIKK